MIISTLEEGRIIEVNKAFSKIMGYAREEVIGRTSEELGLWENPADRRRLLQNLQAQAKLEDAEVDLLTKSDEVKSFRCSVEVIESQREHLALAVLEDVSSRKKSELQMAASQKRYLQITELAQDIIYSVTMSPFVMFDFISPSVERVLGYPVSEIMNEPGWILAHIHPDDRPELASFLSFPDLKHWPEPVVLRWSHRDGHWVSLEHRTSLAFDKSRKVTGFVGIGRDITVRKDVEAQVLLNEARLESLLRLSQFDDPDVQHLLDYALQEAIQLTRSKIGSIYHYSEDAQELVLNTWSKGVLNECHIMSPQTRKHQLKAAGLWGEAVRQRKPVIVNDIKNVNPLKKGYPPGHVEMVRFMSVPVIVHDKIVAVVGVANKESEYDQSDVRQLTLLLDSTWRLVESRRLDEERRQAVQKLEDSYRNEKRQRKELQEEARARGLFIDVLAHELRTPLTPILASSGMLMDILKDSSGVEKKLILNLYNSANNMTHRLEELLDLARYARGTFTLNLYPVALTPYLSDVVERFLPIVEQNRQCLNLEVADGLPVAQIDASRLEQVILNLLSNASKYSPENSEIGFRAAIENGNLRIDVRDQGIGIAFEDQEQLFQPYHRVEQDRQKFPGIGLGLAVARQIVEAHGGVIWVISQPGEGSTFSLHIPVRSSDK